MSIHSSLRQARGKASSTRNVLKRFERLSHLLGKGLWAEGRSIFGLPKIKQEKIKARKPAAKEATPESTEAAKPAASS